MEPSKSSQRSTLSSPLLVGKAVVILSLALCGCSKPSNTLPTIEVDTPESKLELVMQRLDSAMINASAAQGSGVVSQRKSSHFLIPPEKEGDPYRAEVMIQTTLSLAKAPAAATLPKKTKEKKPAEDELALEEDETFAAQPIGEDEFTVDRDAASRDKDEEALEGEEEIEDNGVTRRAIEQSKEVRTKVYELVYEQDRWKLASEIDDDDEVAKYLFEYALR
jgi:hypothetical protein